MQIESEKGPKLGHVFDPSFCLSFFQSQGNRDETAKAKHVCEHSPILGIWPPVTNFASNGIRRVSCKLTGNEVAFKHSLGTWSDIQTTKNYLAAGKFRLLVRISILALTTKPQIS